MNLTKEEQAILDGEKGPGFQKAMEIVAALGEIYGAKNLVPIKSAQVSGVSYKNLGDAGLEFLNEWAKQGAKCTVPTTLNPAGMDLKDWQSMGFSKEFAEKQILVVEAYKKMGVTPTCTCVPYLIGNKPSLGEHIAWAESSAVAFSNSVLGARTNREGGPSSLAAGIVGRTASYGLHLDENRAPTIEVDVSAEIKSEADFGALGYLVGKKIGSKVALFKGIKKASLEQLKSFGASLATYGSVGLYHVEGITPEAKNYTSCAEKISVEEKDLKRAYGEINADTNEVDIVAIGCPHCSIKEIEYIGKKLKGKKVRTVLWVSTARKIKDEAVAKGLDKPIKEAGGKFIADTCVVVAPIEQLGYKSVVTNSGKACFYLSSLNKMKVHLADLDKCLKVAVDGKWS